MGQHEKKSILIREALKQEGIGVLLAEIIVEDIPKQSMGLGSFRERQEFRTRDTETEYTKRHYNCQKSKNENPELRLVAEVSQDLGRPEGRGGSAGRKSANREYPARL